MTDFDLKRIKHLKPFATTVLMSGGMLCFAGVAMAHQEQSFATFDRDKDGKITQSELQTIAEERFLQHDKNGDGVVDVNEIGIMERYTHMLNVLDTDGDQAISEQEFSEFKQRAHKRKGRWWQGGDHKRSEKGWGHKRGHGHDDHNDHNDDHDHGHN